MSDFESEGLEKLGYLEEKAEALGCRVVYPEPTELFIDIDSEAAYDRFLKCFSLVQEMIGAKYWVERPSRSGLPHRHIVVILKQAPLMGVHRILYQALLGSDSLREAGAFRQHWLGNDRAVCLFEPIPSVEAP